MGNLVGFTADIEPESYTDYTNALKADSTANPSNTVLSTAIANLSKGNGSSGASDIAATSALLRTLGFTAPPCFSATGDYNCGASGHPFDAILTLASNRPLDYTRPIPASPTEYDGLGIIEHGLNEVLGGGGLGSTLNDRFSCPNPSNFFCDKFGPLDLYRYSAPDVPSFTTSGSASSYFSVDGGVTDIVGFNQILGVDFGGNNFSGCPVADVFIQDAITCPNQQRENYTTTSPEYSMLLSIGYDPIAAVPEPGTLALLGTSLLGFGALRRRQTPRPRRRGHLADLGLGRPAWRTRGSAGLTRPVADRGASVVGGSAPAWRACEAHRAARR